MDGTSVLVVFCLLKYRVLAFHDEVNVNREPQCYSRFDFELKVVENIASLKAAEKNLQTTVATLQKAVNTLQESIREKPKTVAFMAQLSADMVIEPLGYIQRPIVFDQVSANVGNAYNGYTGVFTAPYKASYHFSIDILSPPRSGSHSLHVHLFRNDQTVGYVFLNGHTRYWIRRTASINVLLDIGDVVRAAVSRSDGSKANTIAVCCLHSHLSGFLIG